MQKICTRFAPSPTGFIHLGNIRSALYPWAFAKHHNGKFILRIEDTDTERSTQESVDVILQSMKWLGLDIDEGPFYQSQRLEKYKNAIQSLLDKGLAYYCYSSIQDLEKLREEQMQNNQKPRYNGLWRPESGKVLPNIPQGVSPVIRFKNPSNGQVTWVDEVKGKISISNDELDDFIIARADGSPTYNFCVVVDDIDMHITHVIRGDDHINNTPKQINLLQALDHPLPIYAHLPTVLNKEGEKLSKRNGATSVMEYKEQGYLPEAIINYLARLGWSHGNDEIFTKQEFVKWFNLENLGKSATQFNPDKLLWINAYYMKNMDSAELAKFAEQFFLEMNFSLQNYNNYLEIVDLLKTRSNTLKELAQNASVFYVFNRNLELEKQHIDPNNYLIIKDFTHQVKEINSWNIEEINKCIKNILQIYNIKMPQLAMPIRIITTSSTNTPSVDKLLYLLGYDIVIKRLITFISEYE